MNNDFKIEELVKRIQSLPKNKQQAIMWVIENIRDLTELVKAQPLTQEVRKKMMNKAIEMDDAYLLILLLLEKEVNQEEHS